MIFEVNVYEEDEEIQIEDFEQAPQRQATSCTRPDGGSEPRYRGRAEDYLY